MNSGFRFFACLRLTRGPRFRAGVGLFGNNIGHSVSANFYCCHGHHFDLGQHGCADVYDADDAGGCAYRYVLFKGAVPEVQAVVAGVAIAVGCLFVSGSVWNMGEHPSYCLDFLPVIPQYVNFDVCMYVCVCGHCMCSNWTLTASEFAMDCQMDPGELALFRSFRRKSGRCSS